MNQEFLTWSEIIKVPGVYQPHRSWDWGDRMVVTPHRGYLRDQYHIFYINKKCINGDQFYIREYKNGEFFDDIQFTRTNEQFVFDTCRKQILETTEQKIEAILLANKQSGINTNF